MNYKLIHSLDNLNKFIEFLPELKENESYFLILIARKKWWASSNIPSAYKLKRESCSKEKIVRTIRQWETEIGTYVTHEGVTIPQDNLGVYIAYNPKDQKKATFHLVKKCLDSIELGNKGINIKSMANDVIQSSNGSKNFIDIDVDVKGDEDYLEIVKFIKSVINEKYLTLVKTNGGFHCLISFYTKKSEMIYVNEYRDVISESTNRDDFSTHGKGWYQALLKHTFKSELNIMSHDLMPLVGCNQGVFVPYQF